MKILIGISVIILFILFIYTFTELIFPYRKEIKNLRLYDMYTDRDWGNDIIQIIAINKDKTKVKYIFLQIDNAPITYTIERSLEVESFFDNYIKLQE